MQFWCSYYLQEACSSEALMHVAAVVYIKDIRSVANGRDVRGYYIQSRPIEQYLNQALDMIMGGGSLFDGVTGKA